VSNLEAAEPVVPCGGSGDRGPCLDLIPAREASIGPGQQVLRALPRRARRMVGPWCFLDRFEASRLGRPPVMDVPPHPHIGLQTVTWLFAGEVLHRDSLGSRQRIRAGELNLMTAGRGIAHSEESRGAAAEALGGLQLWTALPGSETSVAPRFDHHAGLPRWTARGAEAVLLMGTLGGLVSPARTFSPVVGAEIRLRGERTAIPVEPSFEHAIYVVEGSLTIEGTRVMPDVLAYLGLGRGEIELAGDAGAIAFLLGGEPFSEEILMWWNFVARTDAEMESARRDWAAGSRFGAVPGYPGRRLEAPPYIPSQRAAPR
jgi:quercetin 2,3-dioxygenase